MVPGVKIHRLNKRDDDSVLAMLSCTVVAQMDAKWDGCPLGVFLLTVDADLQLWYEYIILIDSFKLCEYTISGQFIDWLNQLLTTCYPGLVVMLVIQKYIDYLRVK